MSTIVKPLKPGLTSSQVSSSSVNFCSWERLIPYLEQAAGLKKNEELLGITADEFGINIHIKIK